ncbi:hypothetical protein AC249_AIPGENE25048 [Exaiptasia diaphana]|nr:hypothetical protein AC249_AIPGENE25048 [Exaiptasia diaphana]
MLGQGKNEEHCQSKRLVHQPDPDVQHQNFEFLEKFFPERHWKRYMIPKDLPEVNQADTGKYAEFKFFNILKQIDEPMVVVHSFKCSVRKTIEVDFLVCHKTRGIMVFEVKATNKANKGFKEGQRQAEKNANIVKQIMDHNLKLKKKEVRYTVVLPSVHCRNASRTEGVYFEDLDSKDSFQRWLDEFRPENGRKFTDDEYDQCLSFFAYHVDPMRFTPSINFIHDGLEKLTPDQVKLVKGLDEEFYIAGPAGSGKTEVLIYKASEKELSEQKKLIVVFHRGLAEYLKWRMESVKKLTIKTFRELLQACTKEFFRKEVRNNSNNTQLVEKAIQALSYVKEVTNNPNNTQLEDNVIQALSDCHPFRGYDSIFVDEAQALDGENWEVLIKCLHNSGPNHYKLIFYDDNQMVSYSNPPSPPSSQVYHLTEVIRNTRNIFKSSLPFCQFERECEVLHKYDGPEVTWNTSFTDNDLEYYSNNVIQVIDSHVNDIWNNLMEVVPMDICVLVESQERACCLIRRMIQERSIVAPFTVEEMASNLKYGHWRNSSKITPGKQCGVVVDSISRLRSLVVFISHSGDRSMVIQGMFGFSPRISKK